MESTWFLYGSRGSDTFTQVLQRELVGSANSLRLWENIKESSNLYFALHIHFRAIQFKNLHSYNCHASKGLEIMVQNMFLIHIMHLSEVGLANRI
jgi:hypothetical protein